MLVYNIFKRELIHHWNFVNIQKINVEIRQFRLRATTEIKNGPFPGFFDVLLIMKSLFWTNAIILGKRIAPCNSV